jgi:hypothetical protein
MNTTAIEAKYISKAHTCPLRILHACHQKKQSIVRNERKSMQPAENANINALLTTIAAQLVARQWHDHCLVGSTHLHHDWLLIILIFPQRNENRCSQICLSRQEGMAASKTESLVSQQEKWELMEYFSWQRRNVDLVTDPDDRAAPTSMRSWRWTRVTRRSHERTQGKDFCKIKPVNMSYKFSFLVKLDHLLTTVRSSYWQYCLEF